MANTTSLDELYKLSRQAFVAAGASEEQAKITAEALVLADSQGLGSHGVSRVSMYCSHLRQNRVTGNAVAKIKNQHKAAVLVDAANGFAFPACKLAIEKSIELAKEFGISIAGVTNSHHFGAAGLLLEPVAKAGLTGLAMGNSPGAMPFAGGKRSLFGTDPIAAIFPRYNNGELIDPMVIDLSMSEVARGKIMLAARRDEEIPLGWALDIEGNPTTNAKQALKGSMLPFGSSNGGTKGAVLALMIEMLIISLTGAHFGEEADSFFEEKGNQPRIGQLFITIDPSALCGKEVNMERTEALITALLSEENVRLPGARRYAISREAQQNGVAIGPAILDQLKTLAQNETVA